MRASMILVGLMISLASWVSPRAGVVPGHWEKVESVAHGTELTLYLNSGERFDGVLEEIRQEDLILSDGTGRRPIPRSAVKEIRGRSQNDSKLDGMGYGMAIGALSGAVLGAFFTTLDDNDSNTAGSIGFGGLLGAGIGAGIGLAADAARKSPELLYQAPSEP